MNYTRTYSFEDFARGPICLNCGEPADHGVELGEEVELCRRQMVAVRLEPALALRLRRTARHRGIGVSALVRELLNETLP